MGHEKYSSSKVGHDRKSLRTTGLDTDPPVAHNFSKKVLSVDSLYECVNGNKL